MSRYVYDGSTRTYDRSNNNSNSNTRGRAHGMALSERCLSASKHKQYLSSPDKASSSTSASYNSNRHPQSSPRAQSHSSNQQPSSSYTSTSSTPHPAQNSSATGSYPSTPSSAPPPPSPFSTAAVAAAVAAAAKAASSDTAAASETETRPAAARSKSRMRRVPPKKARTGFITLGKPEQTENPYKATYHGSEKYRSVRSRSRSVGSRDEEPRGRTRESSEREPDALPTPPPVTSRLDAGVQERTPRSKCASRSYHSSASSRSRSSSSENGRRGSKWHFRKQSAKRASPSPSPSPPPRRETERPRSKSKSRWSGEEEKSRTESKRQERGTVATAIPSTTTATDASRTLGRNVDSEIQATKESLKDAKQELQDLHDEYAKRIEAKNYRIKLLELDLETLEKRKRIDSEYRSSTSVSAQANSEPRGDAGGRTRVASKRLCIVDSDETEDDDDDEVMILDPVTMKEEPAMKRW